MYMSETLGLKKRGRKPAGAIKNVTDLSPIQELIVKNDDIDADLSKKRGRKPKQKTYSVQDVIINKITENKEQIVLHFPFSVKDVYNSDPFNNLFPNTSEPQPFEPDCQANFSSLSATDNLSQSCFIKMVTESPDDIKTTKSFKPTGSIMSYIEQDDQEPEDQEPEDDKALNNELEEITQYYENHESQEQSDDHDEQPEHHGHQHLNNHAYQHSNEIYVQNSLIPFNTEKFIMKKNLNKIMYEFLEANKKGEWPMSTNIYCMWCCHPFDGPPCALPVRYVDEKFYVWGCFCSFNCAAAYNFKEYKVSEVWERYSLLNLMYKKIFDKPFIKIKPAPPREVLSIFGGYLNIDDYRKNMIMNDRDYKIIKPPIISIVPKVEESIIEFSNNQPIPVDKDKIDKAVEKLKLKRCKPLAKNANTLENFMEIKYC